MGPLKSEVLWDIIILLRACHRKELWNAESLLLNCLLPGDKVKDLTFSE